MDGVKIMRPSLDDQCFGPLSFASRAAKSARARSPSGVR